MTPYSNADSNRPLEELMTELNSAGVNILDYYFEFLNSNIHYNADTGRVDQITLRMMQR